MVSNELFLCCVKLVRLKNIKGLTLKIQIATCHCMRFFRNGLLYSIQLSFLNSKLLNIVSVDNYLYPEPFIRDEDIKKNIFDGAVQMHYCTFQN